ncbi:putative MFS family arabinose efflux permease [Nocardioides thalensis]|uniref:Putative MFS family arabinose efflux permease n=1 Tax=Nocardioides thalensis TaxID=1914755 RepID=A0A853BXP5_9ACTN|nr:MFS transporter [Nocardioides thalensis]NYI99535.1 putative MFS family arabinose efflux permease [Nocardioides thalensis]
MSTTTSGDQRGFLRRLIPPTPMSKRLATNSLLFSTGEGTWMTGSAVFLTQVVGMSVPKVGLALTVVGIAEFLLAYPAGRLVDRLGPKRVWAVTTLGRAGCFVVLPFVEGFGQYVAVGLAFAVFGSAGFSAYQAYVLDVLPRKERVETQAYMYSALNVGFTLGALIGGIALAFDSLTVIRWTPGFAAGLVLVNAWWISLLPKAPHDLRVASGEARVRPSGPGPIRNVGWILVSFFGGTLWTNQVLLNVVIPLWLVDYTDAPWGLLAWLFGTNTVLCIFLPAYTSKGVRNVRDAMRYVWISTAFFVGSCLITAVTHSTEGLLTIALVWLGHVTVTGAELAISGASWAFEAELMDPRRRGEYQGVQEVSKQLGSIWAPALFTLLVVSWGGEGWLVIAGIILVATVAMGPSVALAERFRDQHFADQMDDGVPEPTPEEGYTPPVPVDPLEPA